LIKWATRSRAVQAFCAMHVEALNWSGMSVHDYATALLLSPWSLRKWRDRASSSECPPANKHQSTLHLAIVESRSGRADLRRARHQIARSDAALSQRILELHMRMLYQCSPCHRDTPFNRSLHSSSEWRI